MKKLVFVPVAAPLEAAPIALAAPATADVSTNGTARDVQGSGMPTTCTAAGLPTTASRPPGSARFATTANSQPRFASAPPPPPRPWPGARVRGFAVRVEDEHHGVSRLAATRA